MGLCTSSRKDKPAPNANRVRSESSNLNNQSSRHHYADVPFNSWDIEDVADWLKDNALEDLVPIFVDQKITGEVIEFLDESQLDKMEKMTIGSKLLFQKLQQDLIQSKNSLHSASPPQSTKLINRHSVGSTSAVSSSVKRHSPRSLPTPSSYHHNTNPSASYTGSGTHPSNPSSGSAGTNVDPFTEPIPEDEQQYQAIDPAKMRQQYYDGAKTPTAKRRGDKSRILPNTAFAEPQREPSFGSVSIYSQSRTLNYKLNNARSAKSDRHGRAESTTSAGSNTSGPIVYTSHKNIHANEPIGVGTQVEVLSATLGHWVKGTIQRQEPNGRVLVLYLDRQRVFDVGSASLRIRRQGDPDRTSRPHPRGVPPEEQETFDMAYEFWKSKALIAMERESSNSPNPTFAFSGAALTDFVRQHLGHAFHDDPQQLAEKFLEYGYIRPMKTNRSGRQRAGFIDAHEVHYSFHPDKQLVFQQLDHPDRVAWTLHTEVQVYSNSREQWLDGVITEIKPLLVYVQYGPRDAQYGKVVQRYSKSVKSTESFQRSRMTWSEGAQVQVLSKSTNQWCQGLITKVANSDTSQFYMVKYTSYVDGSEKTLTKWMERWSPDLKDISFNRTETINKWGL